MALRKYVSWSFIGRSTIAAVISLQAAAIQAAVHFTLSGSRSDSNVGLIQVDAANLSGSLSFDMGTYLRLGYTHLQALQSSEGYTQEKEAADGTPGAYTPYTSSSHITSHMVDLTVLLYAGETFTPYIFAGYGKKFYRTESKEGDEATKVNIGSYPTPGGGAGLAIKMTQRFSLKLSHSLSLGVKQRPNKLDEMTVDSSSQVGIQYTY